MCSIPKQQRRPSKRNFRIDYGISAVVYSVKTTKSDRHYFKVKKTSKELLNEILSPTDKDCIRTK